MLRASSFRYDYFKSGTTSTMHAYIGFNRDDDVGVFVMSNSLNFNATDLGEKILDLLH